jgi:hypothetical protein
VLARDDRRQVLLTPLEQAPEIKEHASPRRNRRLAPPAAARAAAATAALTTESSANGTRPVRVPVAGSKTSPHRSFAPGHGRPSIQCAMVRSPPEGSEVVDMARPQRRGP